MLNSCYRRDLAEDIRARHGRLFMPLSPDYTAAFMLLAYSAKMAFIDKPLYLNHGTQSTGRNSLMFGSDSYLASLGDVDWYLDVPAPFYTATTMLLRDFLHVKHLVSPVFQNIDIDIVGFFLNNYREFQYMEHLGSIRDVQSLYRQWEDAVARLSQDARQKIESGRLELIRQRASLIGLRRFLVKRRLDGAIHKVANTMRYARHRIAGKPVFSTPLNAAAQSDHLLTS